jgi:predicted phage baseplate assembly protein
VPLGQYTPQIDDRRFDDIVAEVRTRIARYTPEWAPVWTDVNDNDPGITMVQVFAWLTELLTYRMSKVPELNYLKFLELLGIELNPAEPALAEITFPLKETHPDASIIIPERTQVSAESGEGGPPIVFETDRALIALTARLASVQAFDGYAFTDATQENEAAAPGFHPFGGSAKDDGALLLGFAYPKEFPDQVELNLAVWVSQDTGSAAAYRCGLPDTPVYGPARIRWEYWNGVEWQALTLLKDETRALTRSGHIYLKTPAKGLMRRAAIGRVTEERYWIRGRLEAAQYERSPKLLAIRTNTVAARQAETVRDEVLGGSNGRRDQVFRLASAPVLQDTLRIEVDEGDGYHPWTRVGDFFGSSPTDPHYVLNRTSGEVRFGDGVHGRIPVGNVNNPAANVVARVYRVGGGKRGNVAAKALKTLPTAIEGVDDNAVSNLLAAHDGRDEETLEEAKKRAPRAIKSRCRAVTAEDYEYLAMQASTIKRAKALPLFHPDFPGVKVPGVVTVIVVPDGDARNPMPSQGTLRTVCAYLDQRRLLTAELYVIGPTYQRVEVRGEVIVSDSADLAEVKEGIEQTLQAYFHPLKGGEDSLGWPFGGTIFYSRVYQRVFTVPGVQSITRLAIVLDGEEAEACKDVPIKDGALLYSEEHQIQVQYSFGEGGTG